MDGIEIDSVKGKKIRISEDINFIAQPGFGTVRTAEYEGNPCLVKWFSREELGRIGCGRQMYENLTAHLEQESPGRSFLWPADISKMEAGGSLCYVIDNSDLLTYRAAEKEKDSPLAYRSLADFMERKCTFGNWLSMVNTALCLITAFSQLRKKNYNFLHMTEDDIFIQAKTGRILIANMEFAAKGKGKGANNGGWRPASSSRMLPPACVMNKKAPDRQAADYMLAALLFEILYLNHPLEGYRAASRPVMDERAKKEIYGSQPCFSYDDSNQSNRPVPGLHSYLINFWKLYPDYVGDAFSEAFCQEVLKGQKAPIPLERWYHIFARMRSLIVSCPSCGTENIWQSGDQKCRKKGCDTVLKPPMYYYIDEECYPLFMGSTIYRCQLDPDSGLGREDFYSEEAGRFARIRNKPSLQNTSNQEWTVISPDGTELPLGFQETVNLTDGLRVVAEGKTITISSKYL